MSNLIASTALVLMALTSPNIAMWGEVTPAAMNQVQNEPELRQAPGLDETLRQEQSSLANSIRHELATVPEYSVFDWLEAEIMRDGTVVLQGDVVTAGLKSNIEQRMGEIEEVSRVFNEIELLPASGFDDQSRAALYHAIYNWNSPLHHYGVGGASSIHIIVDHGTVTLKGAVSSEMDSQLAATLARSVAGFFEVRNDLRVERSEGREG